MPSPVPVATDPLCDNPRGYKWKRKLCRCEGCRDKAAGENTRYLKRKYLNQVDPLVDAADARHRIKLLLKRDFTLSGIARVSGHSLSSVSDVYNRRNKFVVKSFADSVSKLELDTRYRGTGPESVFVDRKRSDMVSADRARRIIEGLVLQGYTQAWIAEQVSTTQQRLSKIVQKQFLWCHKDLDDALMRVCREVGNAPGPNNRARIWAKKRGFKAIAEWDDLL